MLEHGAPQMQPFANKRLYFFLCGQVLTSNTQEREKVLQLCKKYDVEIRLLTVCDYVLEALASQPLCAYVLTSLTAFDQLRCGCLCC